MRTPAPVLTAAALLAVACAAPQAERPSAPATKAESRPAARMVALKNGSFENAARPGERCAEAWNCTMHADPDSYAFKLDTSQAADGRQALCLERVTNEPWALVTQGLHDVAPFRGRKLRFSVAVRVVRAEGGGTGPWIVVHGPHGNLAHEEKLLKAPGGWERVSVDFTVAPSAQLLEVGATMQGGGRACLDDARLELLAD
jgi:hypothetical protein